MRVAEWDAGSLFKLRQIQLSGDASSQTNSLFQNETKLRERNRVFNHTARDCEPQSLRNLRLSSELLFETHSP